jgi:prephenate dehydrogenase
VPPTGSSVSAAPLRVAIVGAGLVGGSLALALRGTGGAEVTLTDTDPAVRARARALDLAPSIVDSIATAVADADVVVAAVPTAVVADVLSEAAAVAPVDAILTDAASLKYDLTIDVESRLRESSGGPGRFVGGHPMAGSERSGPDAADGALFQGATWILTPTATTDDAALRTLTRLFTSVGARVLALPPERHDELVAVVSHLPQVVASTLADVAADAVAAAGGAVLAVAGGGFRDTTRIAASDPALWLGILAGNRSAVLEAVDAYLARLTTVRDALAADDPDGVGAWLARASHARRQLVPKAVAREQVDLVVTLDDRPGQLARATTALGEAGINVEDLAMRHATEGLRGALLLRVDAAAAERGRDVLAGAGLQVHIDDGTGEIRDGHGPGAPGVVDIATSTER